MDGAVAGSSKKATVYVGGFAPEVNEQQLLEAFVTFGPSLFSLFRSHHHSLFPSQLTPDHRRHLRHLHPYRTTRAFVKPPSNLVPHRANSNVIQNLKMKTF